MSHPDLPNIGPQPRIGTEHTDTLGRRWVKVRHLPDREWAAALTDATFNARIGLLQPRDIEALGYRMSPAKETT